MTTTQNRRQAAAQAAATTARARREATYPATTGAEKCPDCGRGVVLATKNVGNPEAIQYVCSRNCGWNA